ncbi:MAG: hypothetical protein J0H74_16280 [Chitinophagaceae bacterium]|nr:hypothetical protein [Chitinophagaceae bacterium]
MVRNDIREVVSKFLDETGPDARYASFDYCYNYFRRTPPSDMLGDIEKSCMELGFFLASWGMMRASSFLLKKSAKHFEPTIRYISGLPREVWSIDVDVYNDDNIKTIIRIYNDIKDLLVPHIHADLRLVTKVMLGTLGIVPAFDTFFCTTFKEIFNGQCNFSEVDRDSLMAIKSFYEANRPVIDQLSFQKHTLDFSTGRETHIRYPKVKVIDMYGFQAAPRKEKGPA